MVDDLNKKRWLVKDTDGRVRGPFFTDDILRRIRAGELTGEEQIALYPSADWSPISNEPEFYDKLLAALEGETLEPEDKISALEEDTIDQLPDDFIEDASSKPGSITNSMPPPPPMKTGISRTEKIETHTEPKASGPKSRAESVSKTRIEDDEFKFESESKIGGGNKATVEKVIELKPRKKILKKAKAKGVSLPILVAVAAIGLAAYYLMTDTGVGQDDRIHLIMPRKGQAAISADEANAKQKLAVSEFVKDNYENYLRSEGELVQVIEGSPKNAAATALLCLNYLELWPFAHQDSKDLYAVTAVAQRASAIDPAGYEASTCRAVDLFIRGRIVEAKNAVDSVLNAFTGGANPPIAFYYLKARVLEISKDYSSAISYSQTIEQLWPQWLRPYSLEALMMLKNKNYSESANRFRSVLKANPKHQVSQIMLGVVESTNLQNYEVGKRYLESAFATNQKAPSEILAMGYLALAEIALREQNMPKALSYAQKAYANNSNESRAHDIIVQIGGEKKLKETKVYDTQLVYEGDQLVREGDCNAAQAHYREAFNANRKNGIAAMKAAECLWGLSLSTDAIEWLNKAIQADPNLIDAYVLLADYFTQRFNFEAAGQILSKAQAVAKSNYKVYQGFALVEYRRNNYSGAINYANKAIQLYESDVDSYVILARSLLQNQDSAKAFETASKAIELDLNHRKAQIVYAETLAATRGNHIGIEYLTRLVSTYPTITEYRMALGLLYEKDQSYTSAEQVFRQLVTIEEKPKQAFIELAKVLQMQQRFEESVEAFFQAAKLDPADVEALYLAGLVYLQAKKPNDARTQFQRVMRINKEYPLVNYQMGRAELMLDSPQEAIEQAKAEIAKNPNMADPYLLMAEAHTVMQKYNLCAGDYMQAVNLRPQGAGIYVKMARCYRLSGDLDTAVSMINQADRLESGNPEVWKEQGAIYDNKQDRIKAIDAYNQYLVLAPNAPDREQVQARIKALQQ